MANSLLRPDPTFYPSARLAAQAPAETLAYVLTLDHTYQRPDGIDLAWTVALFGPRR